MLFIITVQTNERYIHLLLLTSIDQNLCPNTLNVIRCTLHEKLLHTAAEFLDLFQKNKVEFNLELVDAFYLIILDHQYTRDIIFADKNVPRAKP